jgi:hypothetical protein
MQVPLEKEMRLRHTVRLVLVSHNTDNLELTTIAICYRSIARCPTVLPDSMSHWSSAASGVVMMTTMLDA